MSRREIGWSARSIMQGSNCGYHGFGGQPLCTSALASGPETTTPEDHLHRPLSRSGKTAGEVLLNNKISTSVKSNQEGSARRPLFPLGADQRDDFAGELLEEGVAVAGMADRIHSDIAYSGLDKFRDLLRHVGRRAEHRVFFGGLAKIHRVALAQMLRRHVERGFIRLPQRDKRMKRRAEILDFAAGLLSFARDEIEAVGDSLRRDDIRHPSVAIQRRPSQGRLGATADPDGRAAGSGRLGLHLHRTEAEIAAAMLDARLGP